MLNDVRIPPLAPKDEPAGAKSVASGATLHNTPAIHTDRQEPGTHHARIFGEKTHVDPEYETPLEERGSTFNVSMTLIGAAIVVAVLFVVYVAIR